MLTIIFVFVFILPASYIFTKYSDFAKMKKYSENAGIQKYSDFAGIDQKSLNILYTNILMINNPPIVINMSKILPLPYWTLSLSKCCF